MTRLAFLIIILSLSSSVIFYGCSQTKDHTSYAADEDKSSEDGDNSEQDKSRPSDKTMP